MRAAIALTWLFFSIITPTFAADSDIRKGKDVSAKERYELSERCAKFAAERFKQAFGQEGYKKGDDGNYTTTYSNHYNAKLNKCLMLLRTVHFPQDKEEVVLNMKSLWDIHENQEIATFTAGQKKEADWKVVLCTVLDNACRSESEWDFLVKPYMEE